MGLFDSVYADCPKCGKGIEYQSKADIDPYMNVFTTDNAPSHILRDVLNTPCKCNSCGAWVVLYDPSFPPDYKPPRPVPAALIVNNPKGDTNKHFQGWEWWPDGETFVFSTSTQEGE